MDIKDIDKREFYRQKYLELKQKKIEREQQRLDLIKKTDELEMARSLLNYNNDKPKENGLNDFTKFAFREIMGIAIPKLMEMAVDSINKKEKQEQIPVFENREVIKEVSDKKDNKENQNKNPYECNICMERNINTLLEPCYHVCICDICVKNIDKCPICRKDIKNHKKVYFS